jgi:hypothetical protein
VEVRPNACETLTLESRREGDASKEEALAHGRTGIWKRHGALLDRRSVRQRLARAEQLHGSVFCA